MRALLVVSCPDVMRVRSLAVGGARFNHVMSSRTFSKSRAGGVGGRAGDVEKVPENKELPLIVLNLAQYYRKDDQRTAKLLLDKRR